MQYPASKPTGPWVFRAHVHQEPRCPGCAEFLQPSVIEFRHGWAWCQPCIVGELHMEPWIYVVLGSDSMRQCSTVVNGLRFYTPDVIAAEALTAYEHCIRITDHVPFSTVPDEADGVYALTPAGEVELQNLDTSELERVEADLKRCRTPRD